MDVTVAALVPEKHTKYFLGTLKYTNFEISFEPERLSTLFIVLSGLETLNEVENILSSKKRNEMIDWIYDQQVQPTQAFPLYSGFRCSLSSEGIKHLDCGFISRNYCAIASLCILGDDLSRLNKEAILQSTTSLQNEEGNFKPSPLGGEDDVRIIYCAVSTCYILGDMSAIDVDQCSTYLMKCLTYEGGFGQCIDAEAHGGLTFCAIASLKLMNTYDSYMSIEQESQLVRWCLNRFDNGFAGRPNKEADTCYSFWIGATLVMLESFHLVDQDSLVRFVLSTQDLNGGIAKVIGNYCDPLHTFLGLAGISFVADEIKQRYNLQSLSKIDPAINMSKRVRNHLRSLHEKIVVS